MTKNLTEEMLDDCDATQTKPIENYYGNLDRKLKKAGVQGFGKVTDDLLIKYTRDLIDEGHKWRTKSNRKKAKELKLTETEFNEKQKELVSLGVDEEDAVKLSHGNIILKCVTMCKKLHAGPMTTSTELSEMVKSWTGTEKSLHTSLNYEIRLRKLTFTQVKADCTLFKQKKLSIEDKERNLKSLINTSLEFRTMADMSNLESAIMENADDVDFEEIADEIQTNISEDTVSQSEKNSKPEIRENDIWPPEEGQFIFGLFTDGVSPGEVKEITDDTVNADFLIRVTVPKMNVAESLWKRPSLVDTYNYAIHRNSVLPFYPVVTINRIGSSFIMY